LILRGVAFEFRYKSNRSRWLWDVAFSGGSFIAAFAQGLTVGALAKGLPMRDDVYIGGSFGWLSPFSILCGVGLCLGYTLLGAGWLVAKCEGGVRERAYALLPRLSLGVLVFLVAAFVTALLDHLQIMQRWIDRPYLAAFPIGGAVAAIFLIRGTQTRSDIVPILTTALIFVAAFGALAVSFWPYMIPFSLTVSMAASPHSSLSFMFWGGGLIVLPLILTYTVTVYRVFRGKIVDEAVHH
jgi:cytochrome d ubiquinol oxidase subunit II